MHPLTALVARFRHLFRAPTPPPPPTALSAPETMNGDQSFAYLLGTRIQFRAEMLGYYIADKDFKQLTEMFPEHAGYLRRGMDLAAEINPPSPFAPKP